MQVAKYIKSSLSKNSPLSGEPEGAYYTDHPRLREEGNIRLRYTKNPGGIGLRILEEDHYYPFGLKHQGYNNEHNIFEPGMPGGEPVVIVPVNPLIGDKYKYKFNGMEYQSEMGLDVYDFGARNYDPALGRWMNIDPLAEQMRRHSPYNYAFNNPIYWIDPDGMMPFGSTSIGNLSLDMGNFDGRMLDEPNYIASTVVDDNGKIIDYQDDGDPNIYLNERCPENIIGTEQPGKDYIVGEEITVGDLNEDGIAWMLDGLDVTIEKEKTPEDTNLEIINFLLSWFGLDDDRLGDGTKAPRLITPKMPKNNTNASKSNDAHKRKKQSTGKSRSDRHDKQYTHGGKNRPTNPNQRKGAEKRKNTGRNNN